MEPDANHPGTPVGEPTDRAAAVAALQEVFTLWQAGNQQPALDRLQSASDRGERWAISLQVWLRMQQGMPGMLEAVPWAERAAGLGMPWMTVHLFNNLVANVAAHPQALPATLRLARGEFWWGGGADPVGNAWSLLGQGQADAAIELLGVQVAFPLTTDGWQVVLEHAQQAQDGLRAIALNAGNRMTEIDALGNDAVARVEELRSRLETQAQQAGLLVTSVNAAVSNALFDAEAARNQDESNDSWRWGLGVLAAAAVLAVLPLALHYVGIGPDFTGPALLAAHAGSTAALATVAGVLLTRSRARDRAAQRARDLSTAMGTMISYSTQISDENERQRFMLTMGHLVLSAHLHGDNPAREDPVSGLASLLAAVRPQNTVTPAP